MEIKDLASLSRPLTKLIEVFADGCKWVAEPYQIKRIAKAKAYEASVKSQEEFKQEIMASLLESTKLSIRENRQKENLVNIINFAMQEMQAINSVNDIPVSPEWSARFFDYSQDVCDEEIQIVWAKILAHETASPGTYFKRTLYILKNMEQFEAEWFVEMCQFVLNGEILPLKAITSKRFAFNKLQSMIDCGLVNASECISILDANQIIKSKTHYFEKSGFTELQNQIEIRGFAMTDPGIQLYSITQASSNLDFMQEIKEQIKARHNVDYEIKSCKPL